MDIPSRRRLGHRAGYPARREVRTDTRQPASPVVPRSGNLRHGSRGLAASCRAGELAARAWMDSGVLFRRGHPRQPHQRRRVNKVRRSAAAPFAVQVQVSTLSRGTLANSRRPSSSPDDHSSSRPCGTRHRRARRRSAPSGVHGRSRDRDAVLERRVRELPVCCAPPDVKASSTRIVGASTADRDSDSCSATCTRLSMKNRRPTGPTCCARRLQFRDWVS